MANLARRSYAMNGIEHEIYIFIAENGMPWFKANEIARILDYKNLTKAIRDNVYENDRIIWKDMVGTINDALVLPSNWQPNTVFINESGLYSLMLRSKKPEAEAFRHWVTSEVLPSIRKTGSYTVQSQPTNEITQLLPVIQEIATYNHQLQISINEHKDVINKLISKMIEDKPRLAVMPKSTEKKHKLSIYSNGRKLKFCRAQERNFNEAVKRAAAQGYTAEIFNKNSIPNAMNVLNCVKDELNEREIFYRAKNNEIECPPTTVLAIVHHLLNDNDATQ